MCALSHESRAPNKERKATHIVKSPLNFILQHTIHRRDDLDRHIDQSFAEHEAYMFLRISETSNTKEGLKCGVQCGRGRRLLQGIFDEGFYRRVILRTTGIVIGRYA